MIVGLPFPEYPETEQSQRARAREEAHCSRRVALMLGCCPECWEPLTRIDGAWRCVACDIEEGTAHG